MQTETAQTPTMNATEAAAPTTQVRTQRMNEKYSMTGVDSLEPISDHIIKLLTKFDVQDAKLAYNMTIQTDDLATEKEVQTQSLKQQYVVSGAESLPAILDRIKSIYEEHAPRGVKNASIAIALKLFVPAE